LVQNSPQIEIKWQHLVVGFCTLFIFFFRIFSYFFVEWRIKKGKTSFSFGGVDNFSLLFIRWCVYYFESENDAVQNFAMLAIFRK